ncbi:hypothetical protein [uncultured Clostridium sp.]|uniref:hypothetical protein n=1 Tax=uncultured Clostridium sp. TaxID=59620 RepID=UPI0026F3E066|nr:hypothetical protein [uncultured Clostridium sp.]
MAKSVLKKPKDGTMNFKQILAIAEAVTVGGADLEEVYWKKRLYSCIVTNLYNEGYTFEEDEIDEIIRRGYEKLCLYEGFPYDLNLSSDVLCKVLVVVYSQYCEDTKLFTKEDLLNLNADIEELYDIYKNATPMDSEEVLASVTMDDMFGVNVRSNYNTDDKMEIVDDYECTIEDVEKPKRRKTRRF